AAYEGSRGNQGVPRALIGVRRFELGTSPTRTERATRLRHTPSPDRLAAQKRLDRVETGVGPFADQQVAAVGDDAERSPEPPRVLEAVLDRHHAVARAPEDETGAADAVEIEPRVVADKRAACGHDVTVEHRRGQEAPDRRRRP